MELDKYVLIERMQKALERLDEAEENLTPVDSSVTIVIKEDGVSHHMTFPSIDAVAEYNIRSK